MNNNKKFYTGVGSRSTPENILNDMTEIASILEQQGYILRSGGADGADSAFEKGVKDPLNKEIYLPWWNFNNNHSKMWGVCDRAMEAARLIHPAFIHLSDGGKKLHARNIYQVLGKTMSSPSDFLICWTPEGKLSGGTRTAIKLAELRDIPVYNLALMTKDSILENVLEKQ